jgi:methylmalonyl-CoA mutase N-terminal domain/subunit
MIERTTIKRMAAVSQRGNIEEFDAAGTADETDRTFPRSVESREKRLESIALPKTERGESARNRVVVGGNLSEKPKKTDRE